MNTKGLKLNGSYLYGTNKSDILETKMIEVKGEIVKIEPLFHFERSERAGMIIYRVLNNGNIMIVSHYNYSAKDALIFRDKSKCTDGCSYTEWFYDDYELNKHIMDKEDLFNFISELETVIYNNNINKEDDFYINIVNMKKMYFKRWDD